jgi:tetraacyldisaccharide 4'-kinase
VKAPDFWSDPDSIAARLLAPLGWLVGRITLKRMAGKGSRAAVPVVCVGNPTVGGSGKSPVTQLVAEHLAALGHRPAILARGYGGSMEGPVRVDPARHDATAVGDEPLMHASRFLTVISRDRVAGARLAVEEGATIVVMDDGFQNPALEKDVRLLVVDAAFGLGNGRVIPAGPLRAPFAPQLAEADALVVVGEGTAGADLAREAAALGRPVLRARLRPEPALAEWLAGRDVLAFCGIGRPGKFAETLGEAGARNALLRPFPDHHVYTDADAEGLLAEATRTGLPLVTTEKDAVKLRGSARLAELGAASTVVRVRLALAEEAGFDQLLAPLGARLGQPVAS